MRSNLIGRKFQVKISLQTGVCQVFFPAQAFASKHFTASVSPVSIDFHQTKWTPKLRSCWRGNQMRENFKPLPFHSVAFWQGLRLIRHLMHPWKMSGERRRSREANRNIPLRNWATKKMVQNDEWATSVHSRRSGFSVMIYSVPQANKELSSLMNDFPFGEHSRCK